MRSKQQPQGATSPQSKDTPGRVLVRDELSTQPSRDEEETSASETVHELIVDKQQTDADEDEEAVGVERGPQGAGALEHHAVGAIDRVMRDLLSRHGHAERHRVPQVIGSIGVGPRVGVTTVATSLAHLLSSDFDALVCYLDLTGTGSDQLPNSLADLMSGCVSVEDFFDDSAHDGVVGAAVGELADNKWHSLIRSSQFADTMEQLRRRFDFLVIDLPSVRSDGRTLGAVQHIDAFLLVARHGKTALSDIETALADLSDVDEIGVVVNRYRPRTPRFLRRWLRVR